MLSLQRRADGNTSSKSRLRHSRCRRISRLSGKTGSDLPEPDHTQVLEVPAADSVHRKVGGVTVAEIPVVLAFYRRELVARSWKEEANGAVVTDNEATLNFSSTEQTATLRLSHKYDLTTVSLVAQVKESALATRAKAKKDADDKFMVDAKRPQSR